MNKKLLNLVLASTLLLGGLVSLSSCGENNDSTSQTQVVKDKYVVTYDQNYGNKVSTTEVKHGALAQDRTVKRGGYTFTGWYTDKDCTTKFDFKTPITADITLYAGWIDNSSVVKHTVTFDLNYGTAADVSVEVVEGQLIKSSDVPVIERLGWELDGWYTTEACTDASFFDIDADEVTAATTLYAKYTRAAGLVTDSEGNLVFNNVAINIVNNAGFGIKGSNVLNSMITEFNNLNLGIRVNLIEQTDANQSVISLKIHQTEHINMSGTYYYADEVMDLAGITFDASKYYESQINDCYINGRLQSFPLVSAVPAIIYNKALMAKYTDTVPTNIKDFYTILTQAQTTESATNSNWKGSIVIGDEWDMKEIGSHSIYIQNNAPFYKRNAQGKLVNDWYSDGKNGEAMKSAVDLYRKLFVNTTNKMGAQVSGYSNAEKAVGAGNALMALASFGGLYESAGSAAGVTGANISSKIGIIPVSNFFALEDNEYASKTFVKNFSFGVYKGGPKDLMKIAAAGVFADWASKNADGFTENMVYPCHKDAIAASVGQSVSLNWKDTALKQFGDPANFMTYDGHLNEYAIFNSLNESFMPYLNDASVSETTLSDYIYALSNGITGSLA